MIQEFCQTLWMPVTPLLLCDREGVPLLRYHWKDMTCLGGSKCRLHAPLFSLLWNIQYH